MLLALIFCQLSVLVSANPFHKYPFVFLLDIGNEELEKTNTEQIRLSIPGGSVALRYPAIGNGETIGHIRVSGIDFGNDLKANIVDGGPGYKYVVVVFMGNPGVPYDAVVTVQTVLDQALNIPNTANIPTSDLAGEVEEDANNSAEDLSDDSALNSSQNTTYVESSNAELMQSSSNVYNYAENEVMERRTEFDDDSSVDNNSDEPSGDMEVQEQDDEESERSSEENENDDGQRDIHLEYTDDIDQIDDPSVQVKGIDNEDDDNDEEISPELAQSIPNDYAEDNEPISIVDSKLNGLKPHMMSGEVYYEDDSQQNNRPDYQPLDYKDLDEIGPIFNDGEIHNDDKYKDSNNNYIDSNDNYAVAY